MHVIHIVRMKFINTCKGLEPLLLPNRKAITEAAVLGSVTKPLGFLICKMGTSLALPMPQRKRRICMKELAKGAPRAFLWLLFP